MKKVAILQSNYIPWKGYFDLLHSVDPFIFHDDIQYTKNDWRNRNKIKTPSGAQWITIPCGTNEKRLIYEVELKDASWQRKHWNKIKNNYQKSPFWNLYGNFFEEFYLGHKWTNLSHLNQYLIKIIAKEFLGIKNIVFDDSRKYNLTEKKELRVLELLNKVGATCYISGPAAKDYIQEENFKNQGVELSWFEYTSYPEYDQMHGEFIHDVSILDLLFNCGPDSYRYVKKQKTNALISEI